MPSDDETKLTKGFAFIEFLTPEVSKPFCFNSFFAAAGHHTNTLCHCRKHKQQSSIPRDTTWTNDMHSRSICLMSLTST